MDWYHRFITAAPNDIYGFFALMKVPPGEPFPQHLHNQKVCGIVWCYNGDILSAEEVFKPIRSFKKPVLDFVGTMPFPAIQTMFDAMYPAGLNWYWKALFIKDLNDRAAIKKIAVRLIGISIKDSEIHVRQRLQTVLTMYKKHFKAFKDVCRTRNDK